MKYALLLQPSSEINKTIQTRMEWAKPVAALLPSGGGARSRNRKEFPAGAVSGS